jgi:hypothetical protein
MDQDPVQTLLDRQLGREELYRWPELRPDMTENPDITNSTCRWNF